MSKRFTKCRKLVVDGLAIRGSSVSFGTIGLKALACGRITQKQIESARVAIMRACGRSGKLWIRKRARIGLTKKPIGVRMGGGKGSIEIYVDSVYAGAILFELSNVSNEVAEKALTNASYKLNIPCSIVYRRFIAPTSVEERA